MIPGVAFGVWRCFDGFRLSPLLPPEGTKSFWLDCPLCKTPIPVEPDNPAGFHVLCPGCGDAGVVSEINTQGKREFKVEELQQES